MRAFLKKISNFISTVFIYFIIWFFGGIVVGLGTLLTVAFAFYGCIYATIILVFILPFHWRDLKGFLIQHNWLGFFGRLLILYLIGSYIGGFFAFNSGLLELPTTHFFTWIFFIATVLTWIAMLAYVLIVTFFGVSGLVLNFRNIHHKLKNKGILWF